jgi:hypothetical protein
VPTRASFPASSSHRSSSVRAESRHARRQRPHTKRIVYHWASASPCQRDPFALSRRTRKGPSAFSCVFARLAAGEDIRLFAGILHGETRTRTGDTTIFSRARRPAQDGGIPGSHGVSAGTSRSPDVRSLRIFIAVCGNGRRLRPRFGTRAVWAASGSELGRGFATCGLRRRSPLARITLGGSARFSVKAGTNAASAPRLFLVRTGRVSSAS